jgi:glycogen(starch) synthase
MRILFLTNYYPPFEVGGYEQLCRDVAERLAGRGHMTEILTSDRGIGQNAPPLAPGVYRLLRLSPDYEARFGMGLQFFTSRRQAEAHNLRCLREVARAFEPDVIFIWNIEGLPRSIAVEAECLAGVAVVYWLAGYSPAAPCEYWRYWSSPALKPVVRPFKSLVGKMALPMLRREGKPVRPQMRYVAAVSEYVRSKGLADGTLPAHTRVIYNGVEVQTFYRPVPVDPGGPLCLLLAGRVSADKGVHTAVEAIGYSASELGIRTVHLTVAGSGPAAYLKELQALARRFDIEDMVTFLGWLPREEMPDLMSRCHVLLLPTVHEEPFARVVLEAMAAGLAVVGTLTGGTGELLRHEVTGLAFAAGDSRDLARQVQRLVVETGLRYRLARQGQELAMERFSLESMVDNIECFLAEASDGRQDTSRVIT